ncbi:HD-GYP domain-containing protein [Clostridiaceae bacterium 35-E11]
MLKLNVEFLKSGMMLAKSIVSSDGQVLLQEGVRLKENYIAKLIELGISEIYIDIDEVTNVAIQDVIQEQTRITAQNIMRQTMNAVYMGEHLHAQRILQLVSNILDDLLSNKDIMVNLSDIKAVDDYTFSHSVNVCVLSLITGIAMNYNKTQLKDLGVGAILHDIGKVAIPQEILNKPGSLTNEEYYIIQKHTELGYEILKDYAEIHSTSAIVALTHHERYDGKGYPFGKKAKEIHEFSRIVNIADVYDALTSDRVYKKKILPHQAVEYLTAMGNHQFDYDMVKKFILHVACYPVGTVVFLSTGVKAVVVEVHRNYPNRPKVRCLWDRDGNAYKQNLEIDLAQVPSVTIVEVLENIK